MALKQPPVKIPAAVRRPRRSRENMHLIGRIRQEKLNRPQRISAWLAGCVVFAVAGAQAAPVPTETAADSRSEQAATIPQLINSPLIPLDYRQKTDLQLTELGASWDELSRPEREALLREVKLRMAQRKDRDGVLMIRTQRRYGRIYRSDGRYLKIETKVVRVRPANPNQSQATTGFGVGFEQRSATGTTGENLQPDKKPVTELDAGQSPPVVRVNGPSQ